MDVLTNKRLFWLGQNVFHSVRSLMQKASRFGCADLKLKPGADAVQPFYFPDI